MTVWQLDWSHSHSHLADGDQLVIVAGMPQASWLLRYAAYSRDWERSRLHDRWAREA